MKELPKSWEYQKIGNILSVARGGSPRPIKSYLTDDPNGLNWIKISDATAGGARIQSTKQKIRPEGLSKTRAVFPGDFLLSNSMSFGKPYICDIEGCIHDGWLVLGDVENLFEQEFLYYCLLSENVQAQFEAKAAGSTVRNLNIDLVRSVEIPVAPLPEQRRIVKKLDSLRNHSAAARTHLAAIAKLVERQKLAVLGNLFGKSGSDPKPSEHPWAIPTSWEWKKVKDIGEVGLGRQRSPENHQGRDMRPYIRSANITWSGVDISDVKEMNFDDADFQRFKLKVGDVLLNEGSGSAKEVGKPAIWRGEIPNCCFQNTVLRVQPRDCSSEYLYWYFLLTALSEGFVKDTKGVNIQHIGKGGLANFPIPVPPLDEQDEIVRRIETALSGIDRIAAEAEKALKLTVRLDERILAKAFAGELVRQDPNDEPASLLLDRIREVRANAPKKTRPRRTKATAMKKDPIDLLLADSTKWPANGVTSEELAKRVAMPHADLRDALFELLGGAKPQLEQVFDKAEERMRLKRVTQ